VIPPWGSRDPNDWLVFADWCADRDDGPAWRCAKGMALCLRRLAAETSPQFWPHLWERVAEYAQRRWEIGEPPRVLYRRDGIVLDGRLAGAWLLRLDVEPEGLAVWPHRDVTTLTVHITPLPQRPPGRVTVLKDGRCECKQHMICPLGRTGAETRCTRRELEDAGVEVVEA